MSCVFRTGDDDLWNPASTVGRLFKAEVEAVASVLKLTSGVGELIDDEYEIDLPAFEKFLADITDCYNRATHPILQSLLTGIIGVASVLAERAGALSQVPPLGQEAVWAEQRGKYSCSMPR